MGVCQVHGIQEYSWALFQKRSSLLFEDSGITQVFVYKLNKSVDYVQRVERIEEVVRCWAAISCVDFAIQVQGMRISILSKKRRSDLMFSSSEVEMSSRFTVLVVKVILRYNPLQKCLTNLRFLLHRNNKRIRFKNKFKNKHYLTTSLLLRKVK